MKKIFTLTTLLVLALTVNAQAYRKWNFTNWSAETIANLQEEAKAGVTGGKWSDIEKADGSKPSTEGKCFWSYANNVSEDGYLMANGAVIPETEGLVWNTSYTSARSLAIAVDYNNASNDYAGPQYMWLGSKNKNCFTIPKVQVGQKITIVVESHKVSEARGIKLFINTTNNQLGDAVTPMTQETFTWEAGWELPEGVTSEDGTVDIIVQNTNGCHLYSIEVGDASQKSKLGYIYNGTLDDELAYKQISTNDQYEVVGLEGTAAFTMEDLTAYDAIIISSTLNNADAIASLKAIQPFVPTLNLNPALYEAWGYGAIGTTDDQQVAEIKNKNHALFRGIELMEEEGVEFIPITTAGVFTGVTLSGYFADDDVLATVLESEDVAIHIHNGSHNAYLFIPYTQETLADAATPALLDNAVKVVANSKAKVTQAPKPSIKLVYKDKVTFVDIASNVTGAQVFYTIDGSEPTAESTLFTESFAIDQEGVTVKAVALGDGYLLSEVAEQLVDLRNQVPSPTIVVEEKEGESVVTITSSQEGATIFYNYSGSNDTVKSSRYVEPISVKIKKTIYAFAVATDYVNSELASSVVNVTNPKLRLDVMAHMDANTDTYYEKSNKSSSKAGYFFSWAKDKSAYSYYDTTQGVVEETVADPTTGDEILQKTYTILNPEEAVDFENGWMVRSRGQLIIWENTSPGTSYGDTSASNLASVEDEDANFPVTKYQLNLADKNTTPSDATFPYNAYIVTTQKFKGPFDIVSYIGNGTKPENESKITVVFETSTDGYVWESGWTVVGDTVNLVNGGRLVHKVVRSYEGTDEVYVRAYLCANNSKAQFFDIYLANEGEKTQEYMTGISEVEPAKEATISSIYNVNGVRQQQMQRGLNIVRYSNGTIRKVMVK